MKNEKVAFWTAGQKKNWDLLQLFFFNKAKSKTKFCIPSKRQLSLSVNLLKITDTNVFSTQISQKF